MCKGIAGLLLVTSLSVLVCGQAPAQHAENPISDAPEAFKHVAGELWNRKVVAMADFAHENAYSFHSLMQVLSHWADLAAVKGGSLVLVLEETSGTAEVLREYLRTGQMEPIFRHFLPYTSLDRLEFYQELRDFHIRIERMNDGLDGERHIHINIMGFEPFSLYTAAATYSSAVQAGDVADERDRRVAAGITAYLTDHPNDQILIFYGMDHLGTRPTQQSWAQRLFASAQQWQPLGYLLKQELGRDFLSVAQAPFPPAARDLRNPYHALTSRSVILEPSHIPWKGMQIDPGKYDAVAFLHAARIDEAHLLRYICSRRILDRAIERLAASEGQRQNAFADVFAARIRETLRLLTGQEFDTSAQWREWTSQNAYDGFARMDSDAFAEAVRQECCRPIDKSRGTMLMSLGLMPTVWARQRPTDPEQWRNTTWKALFPRVRFLQCVGIYWVGYPEEKEKAKEYLVQFGKEPFKDPALYLKWYRRECLKLAY